MLGKGWVLSTGALHRENKLIELGKPGVRELVKGEDAVVRDEVTEGEIQIL